MNTPILLLIFNRPEHPKKVLEAIRRQRPARLFIAGDGPRPHKEGEAELVKKARQVVSLIDWPCEVKTNFQETNLGCMRHVSQAITWFFDQVEEGIIFEDDCIPSDQFFPYATSLLEKYRNIPEVMHISGSNFLFGKRQTSDSYYFSRMPHVWGWASWRRAWKAFAMDMPDLKEFEKSQKIHSLFNDRISSNFWLSLFKHIKRKNIQTIWDGQWTYAVMKSNGLAITPNYNLVENIGFGEASTHTSDGKSFAQPIEHMPEMIHPKEAKINMDADAYVTRNCYNPKTFPQKVAAKIISFFKKH